MKKVTSFILVSAVGLASMPASATLTPSLERGEKLMRLPTRGGEPEICVIPTHPSQADYSRKDLGREQILCGMVWGQTAATCPKLISTNPGVEFYQLPNGVRAEDAEAKGCQGLVKVAKYKQSVSCSYTPSILGYYHLSRLLNGAGNVPPAVLRTFDLQHHKEIAKKGVSLAAAKAGVKALIYQTWSSLLSALNAGASSKKKDVLFTDAIDQTYGALQWNPKKEEKYTELFTKSGAGETRAQAFAARNAIFAKVRSSKPASEQVGRSFTAGNVQALQMMKDVSDMVVLDTVMAQEDRFGNIHSLKRYAYRDTADLGADSLPKVKFEGELTPEIQSKGAVLVNVMMMKDNDCGVNRVNRAEEAGLLEKVAHMDPKTYKKLLELNAIADTAEIITIFKRGMMFTSTDWNKVRGNLKSAVTSLQKRCRSGALKLDLDLDTHFSAGALPRQDCEL